MRTLVAIALSTSGCHLVFGSDAVAPPVGDAAADADEVVDAQDAAVDDAPRDSGSCVDHVAPIVSDSYIVPDTWPSPGGCNPSTRYGKTTSLNLGLAVGGTPSISRVLLRFALPDSLATALGAGSTLGGAILRLHTAMPCPSCTSVTTTFAVHALANNWGEGDSDPYLGAGWCMRNGFSQQNQVTWGLPGADGTGDRSVVALAELGFGNPPAAAPLQVPISAATLPAIMNWISVDELSLILVATQGGPMYLDSREGTLPQAPSLTITTCEP